MKTKLRGSHALLCWLALAAAGAQAGGTHGDTGVGEPGKASQVSRTINVDMTDNMRFTPAEISVRQGETVRFVVRNLGSAKHEMVLASPAELKEHYAMMMKMPGMEHADDNMVSVAPGKTGEIVWRFTKSGKIDFACLQPGHFDAGMKGFVVVAQAATAKPSDGHTGHKH